MAGANALGKFTPGKTGLSAKVVDLPADFGVDHFLFVLLDSLGILPDIGRTMAKATKRRHTLHDGVQFGGDRFGIKNAVLYRMV